MCAVFELFCIWRGCYLLFNGFLSWIGFSTVLGAILVWLVSRSPLPEKKKFIQESMFWSERIITTTSSFVALWSRCSVFMSFQLLISSRLFASSRQVNCSNWRHITFNWLGRLLFRKRLSRPYWFFLKLIRRHYPQFYGAFFLFMRMNIKLWHDF